MGLFSLTRPDYLCRVLAVVFIGLFLTYCYFSIIDELHFSNILDSHLITFDDFAPDYARALNLSISQNTKIEYSHNVVSTPKIPRIIHHIWFTGISRDDLVEIPETWSSAQQMCKDNNPDYVIYMWTENLAHEFIQRNYKWFISTYDAYRLPIQRVDALKYFILWHYGGVYVDLDISCRRSLDPLLEFPAWFPRASPLGVNNDLMASSAGHPLFGELVHGLSRHNRNLYFTYPTVYWSTGPMFVNNILKEWFRGSVANAASEGASLGYSGAGDIAILPKIFYSEEYTFFGHRPGGSWHGGDVVVVVWVWERLWGLLGVVLGMAFILRTVRRRRMGRWRL
jgi:mannosyltransferase OCH1-like enzyme